VSGFSASLPATVQGTEIPARFIYNPDDPMAILLEVGEKKRKWTFARDLLRIGIERENGLGDVHVTPSGAGVEVRISAPQPDGETVAATIVFDRFDLWAVLNRTYQICPEVDERIDWDHELRFLGGVA
jgi:hypothetical protein